MHDALWCPVYHCTPRQVNVHVGNRRVLCQLSEHESHSKIQKSQFHLQSPKIKFVFHISNRYTVFTVVNTVGFITYFENYIHFSYKPFILHLVANAINEKWKSFRKLQKKVDSAISSLNDSSETFNREHTSYRSSRDRKIQNGVSDMTITKSNIQLENTTVVSHIFAWRL